MKRALAERAKQSANGVSKSVPSAQQPPLKIPKVERVEIQQPQPSPKVVSSSSATPIQVPSASRASAVLSSNSKRGGNSTSKGSSINNNNNNTRGGGSLKRQRNSSSNNIGNASSTAHDDDDDDDDDTSNNNYSTFFLKHQNSALASELKQLRYQHQLLEKERDYRREQCEQANEALQALEATWNSMEVALQLGQQPPPIEGDTSRSREENSSGTQHSIPPQDAPRSTGTGESVELIGALLDSLAALGKEQISTGSTNTTGVSHKETTELNEISKRVSQRATALQRWIWGLLRKATQPDETGKYPVLKVGKLEAKLAKTKTQLREYETKVSELSKCRDDAVTSERKVRRGLYRLSSGRMKLNEVMKAIDQDGSLSLEEQVVAAAPTVTATIGDGEIAVNSVQLAQLKKQIQDLEEIAAAREKQIEQLSQEQVENQKRINALSMPPENSNGKESQKPEITKEDIQRSAVYTETKTKLVTAERLASELRTKLQETKQRWAQARGDAEHASKSLEDHLAKHKKRWGELTGVTADSNSNSNSNDSAEVDVDGPLKTDLVQNAERIAELEHKLTQALENVRQADAVRISYTDAMKLNESLQSKLEELKGKNAALVSNAKQLAAKAEGGPKTPGKSSSSGTSSKDHEHSESMSVERIEKLQKEHRRMRKELAAAQQSKESARNKLERSLKELESMSKLNARLLRQSGEKDDMNAKSLSTILQLKELTEKSQQEKQLLEQQAKSVMQVNVASRLLANAKDRVAEEVSKERQALRSRIEELEKECEGLKQANEVCEGNLERKDAEMSQLQETALQAKGRCDELVTKTADQEKEKRRLLESLAVAQREASEAADRVAQWQSQKGTSSSSVFTTDQLETQIQHLKSRLTCAVCNLRDKSCILMRCRHMFCKACVEENVRNRSRKCPACGQPFDKKDIGDVWL